MKLPSQYQRGDRVAIVLLEDLEKLLDVYGNPDNLTVGDLKNIAGRIGTVLWVPSRTDMGGWDGRIPIRDDAGDVYNLPFASIVEIPEGFGFVEEPDDGEPEVLVIRDKASEGNLVMQMAAETIQSTYRRYKACRPAVKLRRVSSEEKLVMDMAANTIKEGIRSRRKRTPRAGRPPLPGQDSNPSTPRTLNSESSWGDGDEESELLLNVNDRVEARYKGRDKYYPGIIARCRPDGRTYDISYDDGEREVGVRRELIRAFERRLAQTAPRVQTVRESSTGAPYCLLVSDIRIRGLQSLKWSGKNDPYVRLSIGKWFYETDVVWNAPQDVNWTDLNIIGVADGLGIEGSTHLMVELFNANLVRENELIGAASHELGDMCTGSTEDILLNIVEADKKQRFRCRVEIRAMLRKSDPCHVTSGPNEHNTKKSQSRLEYKDIPKTSSPDRPQDATVGSTQLQREWKAGDRVEAQYRGKAKYYQGTITRVRLHGTFDIDYDDGEKEAAVAAHFIRDIEGVPANEGPVFKIGDRVEARRNGKPVYFAGVVRRVYRNGLYDIKYDDGEAEAGVPPLHVRAMERGYKRERINCRNRKYPLPNGDNDDNGNTIVFSVGDEVAARYAGRAKFYPGVITRCRLGGKSYDIKYNDGEEEANVKSDMIRAVAKDAGDRSRSVGISTTSDRCKADDRVEVRYKGSNYSPGVISDVARNGVCNIDYDNGVKVHGVDPELVRAIPTGDARTTAGDNIGLKVGHRIEARYEGKERYIPGVVTRIVHEGAAFNVDYDDGRSERGVKQEFIRGPISHSKSSKIDVSLGPYLTPSNSAKSGSAPAASKDGRSGTDWTGAKKCGNQSTTDTRKPIGTRNVATADNRTCSKKLTKKNTRKGKAAVMEDSEEVTGFDFKDVDISPDTTRRIVDQAFEIALLEETSSISLRTHEVSLVLDALAIALNPHAFDTLRDEFGEEAAGYVKVPTGDTERHSKDFVLLSLRSPALLAAVITEYANEKHLVNTARMKIASGHFTLSQNQAVTAMKHLISLIHGVWKKIRSAILSTVERSDREVRPALWSPHFIGKFVSTLQLPSEKFNTFNGEEFMSLNNSTITALVRPSILQCRCRLYSQVLRHLDEWWDKGMRPRDPISKNFSPTRHLGQGAGFSSPPKKNRTEASEDTLRKGTHVQICFQEKLLRTFMPIHRAYAWTVSLEDMTGLCALLSCAEGTITSGRLLQGMQWVSLRDKPCIHKNEDSTVLTALRDYNSGNDIVSGSSVHVPSCCLKACPPPAKVPKKISLGDIPKKEIVKGMEVRVQPLDMICRAYERFEWWDRPSSSTLTAIADRTGKIVSVDSVDDTGRVGVSVSCPNSVEVVDALPIEALLFIPRPTLSKAAPKVKPKIMYASLGGSKVVNGNVVDRNDETTKKIKTSRKLVATEAKGKSGAADQLKPKAPTYKAWMRPPLRDSWTGTHEDDNKQRPDEMRLNGYDEAGIGDPYGGDESAPPDMEADTKVKTDEEITQDMISDARVGKLGRTFLRPDRPLYRPITAHDLSTPPTSPMHPAKEGDTAPTYTWLRKSRDGGASGPDKIIKSPRVTVSNVALDNSVDRHNQGSYDARSQHDRNAHQISVNIEKTKARTANAFTHAVRQSQLEEDNIADDAKVVYTVDVDNGNSTADANLCVSGRSFTTLQHKEPAPPPARPVTATSRMKGATGSASARPKSANNVTRKSAQAKAEPDAYPWMEGRNKASEQDTKYNEVLWRELKRTEQETKKKEAILRRQMKRMGNDDLYDSYHNV